MDQLKYQVLLSLAESAAREAGQFLSACKVESRAVEKELYRDIKLKADIESEQIIVDILAAQSNYDILTEESGLLSHTAKCLDEKYYWIVDPLDGSMNFYRDLPISCISIGLFNGTKPVIGVVYDFHNDDMYTGIADHISTLQDKPIYVSSTSSMQDAILCTGFPVNTDFSQKKLIKFVEHVIHYKKVRLLGSAALSLAYVACGKVDVYMESDIMLWDVAAGLALVLGSGGYVDITPGTHEWSYNVYASNNNINSSQDN
tara:strand:+ start:9189 stop:9965 length:777 start_codon:yes stop_codon:yes gene_type:complete